MEKRKDRTMDDLISRAEAIKAVEKYYADHKYITRSRTTLSAICEDMKGTINALPSAQRTGKWLPKHHYIAGHEFVSGHICSECGEDALNAEGDEFLTDFCPNCGARMMEE